MQIKYHMAGLLRMTEGGKVCEALNPAPGMEKLLINSSYYFNIAGLVSGEVVSPPHSFWVQRKKAA